MRLRRKILGGLAMVASLTLLAVATPASASTTTGPTRSIAETAVASIPSWVSAIERGHVVAAIASTAPGTDVMSGIVPSPGEYSVGFDDGQNVASGLPDYFGTRAAIVTTNEGSVITRAGIVVTCSLDQGTSASAFLASVDDALTCPGNAPAGPSAITSAWAWGNSVDPALDNRGLGQPGMAPAALTAFARDHGLTHVNLSVPWASNEGAIATWLSECVVALHAEGITVAALGGDNGWLDDPTLAARWVRDAFAVADFDAVQFDVEPWNTPIEPDWSVVTPQYVAMIDAARGEMGDATVGIDAPWWLTTKQLGSGTVLDTLLDATDTVAIVAFADHALGTGGIVPLSADAVAAAATADVPFSIGVETDTPAIAGGAAFTFFDEGAAVLEAQTALVRTAYESTPGYRGVTVEHVLAWAALVP